MSTRGCIARKTGPGTFKGVYHHWDSYPDGLGATLHGLYLGHFKRNLPLMLDVLLDQHPAGWSTINGADFTLAPGYGNKDAPACYCHGERSEEANPISEDNAADCGCEYVYAFDVAACRMLVLSSYNDDGTKMIGMFGAGNPKAAWRIIGDVDLNAELPDYEKMGQEPAL